MIGFFQNFGMTELLLICLILFLYSKSFARKAGNTVGQLKGGLGGGSSSPPPSSAPLDARAAALKTLELSPAATPDDIKTAYRELVKVWHPDRFPDASLKARAEAKLKEINAAYEKLTG